MNPLFDKPFTFDRVSRIVFSVLMIGGLIYLLAVLKNALLPFLIAWLMAYMMQPFVRFFQYKLKFKRIDMRIELIQDSIGKLNSYVNRVMYFGNPRIHIDDDLEEYYEKIKE